MPTNSKINSNKTAVKILDWKSLITGFIGYKSKTDERFT